MRTKQEIADAFGSRSALDAARRTVLVGIGGAGMSSLAFMLAGRGARVAGTDSTPGPAVDALRAQGVEVRIGHTGDIVQPGDVVVLSDAIPLDSPEVLRARELGLPVLRRSQLLGWLLQGRKLIAVTGTHGKTTTTGMIAAGLRAAGLDPTVIVGAPVPELGGAWVLGGDLAVVEACEAYNAFLDLDPWVAVVTNLELDHADFHGTYESLWSSVLEFLHRVPDDGLVVYGPDSGATEVALASGRPHLGFDAGTFPLDPDQPGEHNRLNAAAAWLACQAAGAEPDLAARGIAGFGGAARRLQVLREGPITVVDDYAHHPSEIRAGIAALRERYAGRRLVLVYQPHLYSRTKEFLPEFAEALSLSDLTVLTDIYPAREPPMPGMSSLRIAELMTGDVRYVPQRRLLPRTLARWAREGDVIVGMGAGDIGEFAPALVAELDRGPKLRVLVARGGDSPEREVSLHSGQEVHAALVRLGYEASLIDLSDLLLSGGSVAPLTGPDRPDAVFLAVHGTHAEDGAVQGFLELLRLPFTGSGLLASALALDKAETKRVLGAAGLPVPQGHLLRRGDPQPESLPCPAVVKPNTQGSTVGLRFVERAEDLADAIANAFRFDVEVLVEEWLRGVEISVPVLVDQALPPVEIVPASGRYDFESKYTPGQTDEICPARLSPEVTEHVQALAVQAHRLLGCRGLTRTDMIVGPDRVTILEVNTLPGMTATSLAPRSAQAAGISFDQLVDRLVRQALEDHGARTT